MQAQRARFAVPLLNGTVDFLQARLTNDKPETESRKCPMENRGRPVRDDRFVISGFPFSSIDSPVRRGSLRRISRGQADRSCRNVSSVTPSTRSDRKGVAQTTVSRPFGKAFANHAKSSAEARPRFTSTNSSLPARPSQKRRIDLLNVHDVDSINVRNVEQARRCAKAVPAASLPDAELAMTTTIPTPRKGAIHQPRALPWLFAITASSKPWEGRRAYMGQPRFGAEHNRRRCGCSPLRTVSRDIRGRRPPGGVHHE